MTWLIGDDANKETSKIVKNIARKIPEKRGGVGGILYKRISGGESQSEQRDCVFYSSVRSQKIV
jgi:hypothetical protein